MHVFLGNCSCVALPPASLQSWYWVADFCTDHDIEFVLGHALYMKAIHGGKAKNDKIDSEKLAAISMCIAMTIPGIAERCVIAPGV